MPDKQKEPRPPKLGEFVKGMGTVVNILDVPPPPPPEAKFYVFKTVRCRVQGRINGEVVFVGETYDDKDSTNLEEAKDDARRTAKNYGPSDLMFVIVQTTHHVLTVAGSGYHGLDPTFCHFKMPHGQFEIERDIDKDVWEYRLTPSGGVEKDLTKEETT